MNNAQKFKHAREIIRLLCGEQQNHGRALTEFRRLTGWSFNKLAENLGMAGDRVLRRIVNPGAETTRSGELPWYAVEEMRAHLLNIIGRLPEWTFSTVDTGTPKYIHHNVYPRAIYECKAERIELVGWMSKVNQSCAPEWLADRHKEAQEAFDVFKATADL